MLAAVQHRLVLVRPRTRSARRQFCPSQSTGTYRLPHAVRDRLASSLAAFRNGERALALATFLGRFWSMPGRVALPFPIDRRALTDREDLGLTEGEVRGAIRTLEAVGFLARFMTTGSRYKATPDGLRRKPVPFQFGPDYMPLFIAANGAAAVRRGDRPQDRRPIAAEPIRRASMGFPEARHVASSRPLKLSPNLPKDKSEAQAALLMGKHRERIGIPPSLFEPNSQLEAALERLKRAIGDAGAKRRG